LILKTSQLELLKNLTTNHADEKPWENAIYVEEEIVKNTNLR